ncbi:hypothetical protein DRQ29_07740 [bacterium]|nr:MAG: hypothetical protein DRQ29_07740 [bacterium]
MMKILFTYILSTIAIITLAQCQYSVDEITIRTSLDTTYVQIFTSGSANFKKFTIDNPPKLGIDFFEATYNLPQKEYLKVPAGIIMAVRGSQFKPFPEPVARIVLDLVETTSNYDIRSHPEGVIIAIHTPGYPKIEKWTSGRGAPAKNLVPAVVETTTKAVPESISANIVAVAETTKTKLALEAEELPPELAMYMRPETLTYKGITADRETIDVAKYIRNMVIYIPSVKDPFITPKPTKKVPIGTEPVPAVDKLSVVGIVQMGNKNVALMQDETGFGYVVAPGDTVEDGICSEVTDTSARFDLIEFGQVRKVEIPLVKAKK